MILSIANRGLKALKSTTKKLRVVCVNSIGVRQCTIVGGRKMN
jgi:hypothetical protein